MARGKSKHTRGGRYKNHVGKSKGRKIGKHKSLKTQESLNQNDYSESHTSDAKRRKVEDVDMPRSKTVMESSSEDSADELTNMHLNDPYNQLLSTFSTFNSDLQKKAIESDESDEESADDADVDRLEGLPFDNGLADSSEDDSESDERNGRDLKTEKSSFTNSSHKVDEEESQDNDSSTELEVQARFGHTSGSSGIPKSREINDKLTQEKTKALLKPKKRLKCNDALESKDVIDVIHAKDDVDESSDPFAQHFCYDMDDSLYETVSNEPLHIETCHQSWPIVGHFLVQLPKGIAAHNNEVPAAKVTILEEKKYVQPGSVPKRINVPNWSQMHIKSQIRNNITTANAENIAGSKDSSVPLSPLQRELFSLIYNYQDVYFPYRTLANGEEVRFMYCLHAVNHILKTRSKILHHNAKLSKKDEVPDEFRDQGLVRPKVVILVPFRESALRVVKLISALLFQEEKGNVMHMKRFIEEHSGEEIAMPKKNPRPEDYEATFVGNTDDTFRIGMTVTRKSLKLYADFYSADIIVASPLGLRMIVGAEGEVDRDFDFLASIELLVLDQTELFIMQNWDHVLHILDHFHLQPKESHGTDFSRVRSWALNGWARYYRQTLVFSSLLLPEISALVNKKCHNYAGKIRVINPVPAGTICQVVVQLPQVFYRFDATSATQAIDARLDFFTKKILPQFKDSIMSHTMVYIPSYFDFVCLRNYFKREDIGFVQICEYSKDGKVARARDMFFHTEAHFLLYSERFHFFRRFRIKGIRHLIFYQPPTFPHFYSEMCNLMQEANQNKTDGNESNMTVTLLYSKYDIQQLAALVGTDRAKRMVTSERSVHMFMTGD